MPTPTTQSGKLLLDELTNLSRAAKFRAGDFKALRQLQKSFAETNRLRSQVVAAQQGLKEAKQATKETADLYKDLNKRAREIGKTADESKKLWDRLLSKIPGGNSMGKVTAMGGLIAALLQIALVAALQTIQQQLNNLNIDNINRLIDQIPPIATQSINNKIEINGLQKREQERIVELNDIKEQIHLSEVNAANLRQRIEKQVNDVTYEVRKGREIVENKINDAKKQANDALYEVRQGRQKIETQIANIKAETTSRISTVKAEIDARISIVNSRISDTINTFSANLQAKINATVEPLKLTLTSNKAEIEALKVKLSQPTRTLDPQAITKQAVDASLAALNSRLGQINQENYGQNIKIDAIGNGLLALGTQLKLVNGRVEVLQKTPINIPPQKNYDADIANINNRLKEQERVNSLAIPKLDQILGLLPLIPAKTAGFITPQIPTIPQIETAAATGTCRTTQPGGCMRKLIDDSANNINQNTNNKAGNILNAVNTGLNAADLALLGVINNKLGAQLPGGIAGKLNRFSQWLHLDRALNLLTFAATIHNAFMLSNDIGQTLLSALNNVLQTIGLKDDEGKAFDIGKMISGTIESFIKSIIGAENYKAMTTTWAMANRIYQSTTNVINSFSNIGHTIVNAVEIVGGQTSKIGNALRICGTVGEKLYGWMNPQPNYHSRMLNFFQNAQQGASTILQVTQVPIDVTNAITEFNNSTTELVKAVQQEPETKDGKDVSDAQKVKEKQEASKTVSIGASINLDDIFNANE